jgi:hypothetical protein
VSIDGYRSPPQGGSHQGSPLPARAGETSGVTNGFISQIEKNRVSPRSPPAQGAGRHSHVAGHLLHRRDGDGFRGDLPPPTRRISAPTPSATVWWASRANRAIGMMQEILPRAPTPVTTSAEPRRRRVRHRHPGSGGSHGRRAGSPADARDGYYFDSRTPHRFRNVDEHECVLISATRRQLLSHERGDPAGIPLPDTGSARARLPSAARPRTTGQRRGLPRRARVVRGSV